MRNRFVLGSGSHAAFQGRAARTGELLPLCFVLHPSSVCRASSSAHPCLFAVCGQRASLSSGSVTRWAGQEAVPASRVCRGASCSVDRLKTGELSGIFKPAGAGWGDPHPSSWFRFLCFCLEEQTGLGDSLPGRTAWPGCCS